MLLLGAAPAVIPRRTHAMIACGNFMVQILQGEQTEEVVRVNNWIRCVFKQTGPESIRIFPTNTKTPKKHYVGAKGVLLVSWARKNLRAWYIRRSQASFSIISDSKPVCYSCSRWKHQCWQYWHNDWLGLVCFRIPTCGNELKWIPPNVEGHSAEANLT